MTPSPDTHTHTHIHTPILKSMLALYTHSYRSVFNSIIDDNLPQKLIVTQEVNKILETKGSLPYWQEPVYSFYSEPVE